MIYIEQYPQEHARKDRGYYNSLLIFLSLQPLWFQQIFPKHSQNFQKEHLKLGHSSCRLVNVIIHHLFEILNIIYLPQYSHVVLSCPTLVVPVRKGDTLCIYFQGLKISILFILDHVPLMQSSKEKHLLTQFDPPQNIV